MHINLNYDLDLQQRIDYAHSLPLNQYNEKELELIANYILYMDKSTPKSPSKHVKNKTQPATNEQLNQHKDVTNQLPKYTKPRPIIHTDDPTIQQYEEVIKWLSDIVASQPNHPDIWKLKKWKLQHNLDMGLANTLLYPTNDPNTGFPSYPELDLDELVDLTNSFHISKLIEFYSDLRQSEQSKLWVEWIERNIIDKTPMYDWQRHLLVRRIDKMKQISIAVELAEKFGKIVTPSTMSQTMRSLYRQIAITAERELYAYHVRDYPAAWRKCSHCGELKLIKFDFYTGRSTCKQCGKLKRKGKMSSGENK